jgi:predicted secreted Zn-dependent protease
MTNYYSVTGTTLVDIRQSINRSRPWKGKPEADAVTDWRVEWRFTVAPTRNGCRCSSFSTTTAITVTMPRWTVPLDVAPEIKKRWERYLQALGQHEAGHAQLARAAAVDLHRRLNSLGEQSDCDGLRNQINEAGQAVIEEYRKRERDYDEKTRHGATQGATLR